MENRIILFLVLSMAIIVLDPYLMEKMGIAKRPVPATSTPAAKKKDAETAPPAQTTTVAPVAPKPAAMLPAPAGEREQEVTVETDLVRVVLSNRGGVIKQWELKRFLDTDPKNPKPIQLVPTGDKGVALIPALSVEVPDAKLHERLAKGVYAVSGKDLSLNGGQPTGEIG